MEWLTAITTLVAAFAPALITISSNKHQEKLNEQNNNCQLELNKQNNNYQLQLRQLDYNYSKKSSAVDSYLESLNKFLKDQSEENLVNYQTAFISVSMYVSKKVYNCMCDIDVYIKQNDFKTAKLLSLTELSEQLNFEAHQYEQSN